MKSSRLRRRLAGAAAAAVLAGTGVLVGAPAAVAKANILAIDKVSLRESGLQVKVTYSCDVDINHQLVANALKLNGVGHEVSHASGTVKVDKLICDFRDHTALVNLRPAAVSHFAKGDKLEVVVYYFDDDGFTYAQQKKIWVL
ncbi:hypothetical protein [Streptomyces tubercidicus]